MDELCDLQPVKHYLLLSKEQGALKDESSALGRITHKPVQSCGHVLEEMEKQSAGSRSGLRLLQAVGSEHSSPADAAPTL